MFSIYENRTLRQWLHNAGERLRRCPSIVKALAQRLPNKHETFKKGWYNDGPSSTTLAQHCTNIWSKLVFPGKIY